MLDSTKRKSLIHMLIHVKCKERKSVYSLMQVENEKQNMQVSCTYVSLYCIWCRCGAFLLLQLTLPSFKEFTRNHVRENNTNYLYPNH